MENSFISRLGIHIKTVFTLQPYGNQLLTSGARQWLVSAWIVIFIMASVEMLAWGYIGFLMSESYPWLTALATALIVFLLIWILDSSLMLLDLRANSYAKRLEPIWEHEKQAVQSISSGMGNPVVPDAPPAWWLKLKERDQHQGAFAQLYRFWQASKLPLGFLGRLFISIASMVITAPFLALMVFSQDIAREQTTFSDNQMKATQIQIQSKYDKLIANVDQRINEVVKETAQEAAGKGLSKRFGEGPVTKQIQKKLEPLESEKKDLIARRQLELQQIKPAEKVAANPIAEKMEAMRRLKEPNAASVAGKSESNSGESILKTVIKLFSEILVPPENAFQRSESAIRAFVMFIILALILLKLFQPASVSLYLSERLQSIYVRYVDGEFNKGDRRIPNGRDDRLKNPLDFEMWAFQNYPRWLAKYIDRSDASLDLNFSGLSQVIGEKLRQQSDSNRSEIDEIEINANTADSARASANQKIRSKETDVKERMNQLDKEIADLEASLGLSNTPQQGGANNSTSQTTV